MPRSFKGVLDEWKAGKLHSGSKKGPVVTSQKQAEAIAFSEQRQIGGRVTHADVKKHPGMKKRS